MSYNNQNFNAANDIQEAEKWDHCLENGLRKTTLGALYAAIPALLLVRNFIPRVAVVAFGAGVGAGIAYTECRYMFEKGYTFQRAAVISAPKDETNDQ